MKKNILELLKKLNREVCINMCCNIEYEYNSCRGCKFKQLFDEILELVNGQE